MSEVFRGIWVIAYRELLRFSQDRARMVSSFAMPLTFLVIFGAGFSRIVGSLAGEVGFTKFMYPGIIGMTVLMTSMFSGISVVWDREFGFLREVLVAPINRTGIVIGKVAGGAIVAMLQSLMMLAIAPLVGVDLSLSLVLKLVPLVLVVSLPLAGLGIAIASRMRSQQGFQVAMQVLIFPLIFLSGVFFPVDGVPTWMEVIAKVNPVTYGVDAIRQLFLGAPGAAGGPVALGVTVFGHRMGIIEDTLVVGVLGVALVALAAWLFSKVE